MIELTELQRDALMETFNIGVGRASRSLASLLGCEAALSVPIIIDASASGALQIVDPQMLGRTDVCIVSRSIPDLDIGFVVVFQGAQENITSLLNIKGGKSEADPREIVTSKVATMISESCTGQLEGLLEHALSRRALIFSPSIPARIFEHCSGVDHVQAVVKIDILLKRRGVAAHFLVSLTSTSAAKLGDGLNRMLEDSEG